MLLKWLIHFLTFTPARVLSAIGAIFIMCGMANWIGGTTAWLMAIGLMLIAISFIFGLSSDQLEDFKRGM